MFCDCNSVITDILSEGFHESHPSVLMLNEALISLSAYLCTFYTFAD